jgi:hypothetical protein
LQASLISVIACSHTLYFGVSHCTTFRVLRSHLRTAFHTAFHTSVTALTPPYYWRSHLRITALTPTYYFALTPTYYSALHTYILLRSHLRTPRAHTCILLLYILLLTLSSILLQVLIPIYYTYAHTNILLRGAHTNILLALTPTYHSHAHTCIPPTIFHSHPTYYCTHTYINSLALSHLHILRSQPTYSLHSHTKDTTALTIPVYYLVPRLHTHSALTIPHTTSRSHALLSNFALTIQHTTALTTTYSLCAHTYILRKHTYYTSRSYLHTTRAQHPYCTYRQLTRFLTPAHDMLTYTIVVLTPHVLLRSHLHTTALTPIHFDEPTPTLLLPLSYAEKRPFSTIWIHEGPEAPPWLPLSGTHRRCWD